MRPSVAKECARSTGAVRPVVERLAAEIWRLAEVSFQEEASSKAHLRELEAAGFRITSTGTAGLPTAFLGEWSQGDDGPVIGFLAESRSAPKGPSVRQRC